MIYYIIRSNRNFSNFKMYNNEAFIVSLRILATFLARTTNADDIRPRVIGGQDADLKEYPYLVMIIIEYFLYNGTKILGRGCTGSLVTEQWVLTAGHCGGKWIRYADTSVPFEDENMFIRVIKNVPFPNYINPSRNKDVNLLKLLEKANLTSCGRISVMDYRSLIGKRAVIIGFGLTYLSANSKVTGKKYILDRLHANRSIPLQRADMVVRACSKYKLTRHVYDVMGPHICLAPTCNDRKVQPYFADSGSPLLVDGYIVGVCSTAHRQNIGYTAISPYLNWMQNIIGKE
ncbi:hypothetical protein K1T71_007503 [Dendrolimus kikuchii]|uniref:Uncharacterized protein n=1 Tax=Dendrolimus kikuchii TaxID=765133 RepID=A0ACC1D0J7_9NEOP|nr:hypothetical protein K1T71_007503 [Dendrolimus kikuchii]